MVNTELLYFTLVYVSQVFGGTHFERDVRFENSYLLDSSLHESMSTALPNCARQCHDNEACLSFVHNRHDERCQLFSKLFFSQLADVTQTGNVMFRKTDDEPVCEMSTVSIPRGRLLSVDGLGEGSKANFACDDYYFPTVLHGVCQGGTWSGLDNACVTSSGPPYTFYTVGRAAPGRCIILPAITPEYSELDELVLAKDADDVAVSVHFDSINEVIERKSMTGGAWGPVEQETPFWPLVKGQDVNLTLCIEATQFRMYVDGSEMFTYNHRLSPTDGAIVYVLGFVVKGIFFTE